MQRILVIEDNELFRMLFQRLFADQYEIDFAEDGKRGLEAARERRPDLILLDLRMPLMNGVEVLETIRSDPDLAQTPVVTMSASLDIPEQKACEQLGISASIDKANMDNATLKQTVIAAMANR